MEFERLVAKKLEKWLNLIGGVCVDGPKNCGKTTLCKKFAKSSFYLNDENTKRTLEINQKVINTNLYPTLIDEWQYLPSIINQVKLSIDNQKQKGMFLLTSSIIPIATNLDVSVGRIIYCTLRTMTLTEMRISQMKVSFNKLMNEKEYSFNCVSKLTLDNYIDCIIKGGWPETFYNNIDDVQENLLNSYLVSITRIDKQFDDTNRINSSKLANLLSSLSRFIGNQLNASKIANECGIADLRTFDTYLNIFSRRFIYEPLQVWKNHFRSSIATRIKEKCYIGDTSIACAILGVTKKKILNDFNYLGFLFENLVIHDLRIYAELINASISYIRDETGYEIDCVIENRDGTFAVFEIKLGSKEGIETGIKNLNKLESKLTEDKYKKLISKNIIVATGFSYRHESGINIIAFGDLFFDSTIL